MEVFLRPTWICRIANPSRSPKTSVAGFSLLEVIVAVIVVQLAVLASLPPIAVAVATRIQNYRTEQALKIAQGEVDFAKTYPKDSSIPITTTAKAPDVGPPSGSFCPSRESCSSSTGAYLTNDKQFFVQRYRNPTACALGVRVYHNTQGEQASGPPGDLTTTQSRLLLTSNEGDRRQSPLAVIYTELQKADCIP
jgi:type II secretory pathway pseudopilin PulG